MINEAKIQELIKRQKDTELIIKAFCANEGIPESSYYYWRKKLEGKPCNRFIPLLVNPAQTQISGTSKYTREHREHQTIRDDYQMEITYPNGDPLSGLDL